MPSPDTVKKALAAIKRTADYEYFFSRLRSPDWLKPLWDAGLFRKPPPPIKEGKYISFPFWPESRYLARMAPLEPEIVSKIALQIPETENVRVHEDLIDAALEMPAYLAAKLIHKAKSWAGSPRLLLLPEKLGQLISHFARGNQIAEALDLTRTFLAPVPGDEVEAELPGEAYRSRQDPEARFDGWHYEQILEKNIPDLVAVAGERALLLLCDLLDSAVTFRRSSDEDNNTEDYSYIWRAAIEDHGQNHSFGIATLLVSAVRDAGEKIAEGDSGKIPELVRILEGYKWNVFQRIALHLLRLFPDAASSQITERITDRKRFDEIGLRHEYVLLLQSQFAKLTFEDQKIILGWIDDGPNLETFKTNEKETTWKEPSDEETKKYIRAWKLQRLGPLRDVLPPDWKKRYAELVKELGEPEHPEFVSYGFTWSGPSSPKTVEELRSTDVKELVLFLRGWQAPEDPMAPSPEGLGRELTAVVASDPERFAKEAHLFRDTDATYVRGIISGFRDAANQKRTFPWLPVLDLCQWVVDQRREISEQQNRPLHHDPGWGWSRKTIADLLEKGFDQGPTEIPFGLRDLVWKLLKPITDDPEPTPDYEARYGGSNMDPATLSINTTRGEAMHALVRYALWVRRHIEQQPDAKDRLAQGFDEMPEVREILEAHLATDPSLAVRSVYGRFFPWLLLLDTGWAQAKVHTIFPLSDLLRSLFDAAWDTYVVFCPPYDNVFEVLRPIYAHAIEQLGTQANRKSQAYDPEHHLAAHLTTYYWRGKLEIKDDPDLLRLFWSKTVPKLRGYVFEHVGRSLSNTKDEIPGEIIARLKRLWEFRLAAAKASSQPLDYKEELAGFSWCFSSGKFDDTWAINQLQEVLKLVNKIDFPKFVVERLVTVAGTLTRASVDCLKLLVESELESWEIYSWRDEAKKILSTAIQGPDPTAKETAIELVHRLGTMGHLEFRDILPKIT